MRGVVLILRKHIQIGRNPKQEKSENILNQLLVMLKNTGIKSPDEFALNRGIELMLPRRRAVRPSNIDRTFRLLNRWVRIRIDIRTEETDGN